eukprot:1154869-Pelagomonas_calceolata.AAC.4
MAASKCAPSSRKSVQGAVSGNSEVRVTHMYADDLYPASNQPQQLQPMLDRLHVYARRKGRVINTA